MVRLAPGRLSHDVVFHEDRACGCGLRGNEAELEIDALAEETDARAEDDGFDGEEELVDDTCFHESSVDLGAAADGDCFRFFTLETLHEVCRGFLSSLDERVTVHECASFWRSKCLRSTVDDVPTVFEWLRKGDECRRTEDDDTGLFRQTNKSAFVLSARPIEWRMPGISRDEAVSGECCDDEGGHGFSGVEFLFLFYFLNPSSHAEHLHVKAF